MFVRTLPKSCDQRRGIYRSYGIFGNVEDHAVCLNRSTILPAISVGHRLPLDMPFALLARDPGVWGDGKSIGDARIAWCRFTRQPAAVVNPILDHYEAAAGFSARKRLIEDLAGVSSGVFDLSSSAILGVDRSIGDK